MNQYRISGLDFFKLLAAIAMAVVHCGLILSRGLNISQPTPTGEVAYDSYLLIGFFSLCLPTLAGSSLRIWMDKYYSGGRILNYDIREVLAMATFLMIAESFKNVLAYQGAMFFSWDVLHFTSVSLVISVLLLRKWGIRSLYVFTAFSLLMGWAGNILFSSDYAAALTPILMDTARWTFRILLFVLPSLLFLRILFAAFPSRGETNYSKVAVISTVGMGLGLAVSFGVWLTFGRQIFFTLIAETLPLAVFIKHPDLRGHMWPLFPWFALIGGGFIIANLYQNAQNKMKMLGMIFSGSLVTFLVFLFFGFDGYKDLMISQHYFSAKVFMAPPSVLLGLLGFYGVLFSVFTLIFEKVQLHSVIVYRISRGILFFYLLHFVFAILFYKMFAAVFGPQLSIILYPWFIIAITYAGLSVVLRFADRPLQVNLRRRT